MAPLPRHPVLIPLAAILLLAACAAERDRPGYGLALAERTTAPPSRAARDDHPERPAAIAASERIDFKDLQTALAEAAGAVALEEVVLDRALASELSRRGLSLDAGAADSERALLARTLAIDSAMSDEQAAAAVERLRTSRGLGPTRYKALLLRSAGLRRFVRDEVEVSPAEVDRAVQVRFGPRITARVIVVPREQDAADARAALKDLAGPALRVKFAELAMTRSTDESASRGGLVGPFSTAEPRVPLPIARVVAGMAEGELSPAIATDQGYTIILLESRSQPVPPPPDAQEKAREEVRLRKERAAMDALARTLVDRAGVTVFDDSLRWSWSTRRNAGP